MEEKIMINGGDITENKLYLTVDINFEDKDELINLIKSKLGDYVDLDEIKDLIN